MIALDTSALAKLLIGEAESRALVNRIEDRPLVASSLVRTELRRAAGRVDPGLVPAADALLAGLTLVHLDDEILDEAGRLAPSTLRALDAIHICCALLLGDELDAFVTYDRRQADAARAHGLPVIAPS